MKFFVIFDIIQTSREIVSIKNNIQLNTSVSIILNYFIKLSYTFLGIYGVQ